MRDVESNSRKPQSGRFKSGCDVMKKPRGEFERRMDEELGITLYGEDLPNLETVGGLHSLVLARIAARDADPWLTLKVFRELRGETRKILGDPNLKVRPSDRVIDIVPWTRRRAFWKKLRIRFKVLGYEDLRRPDVAFCLIVALTLGGMRSIYLQVIDPDFPENLTLLGLMITFLFPFIMAFLTRPLKVIPPDRVSTFGDITLREISVSAATKAPPEDPVKVVNQILMDTWNLLPGELKPSTRLFTLMEGGTYVTPARN